MSRRTRGTKTARGRSASRGEGAVRRSGGGTRGRGNRRTVSRGAVRRNRGRGGGNAAVQKDRIVTVIAVAIIIAAAATIGIVLLSFAGKAYHYAVDTEDLIVKKISVEGNNVLSEEELIRISGIHRGDAIMDVDLARVKKALEANPRIRRAVVVKKMPDEIRLEVEERVPVGLVQEKGKLLGVDAEGVIVPLVPAREEIQAPIITGAVHENGSAGLREALAVIEELRPDLVRRISEVRLTPEYGISLITTGRPIMIRLGRGDYAAKIDRLRKVLSALEREGSEKSYIDLRFRDVITKE